jgi:hypothetical protein
MEHFWAELNPRLRAVLLKRKNWFKYRMAVYPFGDSDIKGIIFLFQQIKLKKVYWLKTSNS